ncbi:hypothetical protein PGTUg99_034220 [Puccinia graminis f. sp. tritici]|uniref:Uncharacterized protein n=1 Tax=Puccinia graminis f. sp. tritici TaxID=56615 RepID=A0A5B0MHX9_PUCGR|nr:hypothetical protein PGTUg99_034220 [Puccinia graminis f. sp. tritici]
MQIIQESNTIPTSSLQTFFVPQLGETHPCRPAPTFSVTSTHPSCETVPVSQLSNFLPSGHLFPYKRITFKVLVQAQQVMKLA